MVAEFFEEFKPRGLQEACGGEEDGGVNGG